MLRVGECQFPLLLQRLVCQPGGSCLAQNGRMLGDRCAEACDDLRVCLLLMDRERCPCAELQPHNEGWPDRYPPCHAIPVLFCNRFTARSGALAWPNLCTETPLVAVSPQARQSRNLEGAVRAPRTGLLPTRQEGVGGHPREQVVFGCRCFRIRGVYSCLFSHNKGCFLF